MNKIHFIDGEKGGVGKSFFSKTLIEYLVEKNQSYTLVDADRSNPDVSNLYPDNAHQVYFSDVEANYHLTDVIFELALEDTVLVNLPAQVKGQLQDWFVRNNIFEVCQNNNIQICRWFVSNGGFDSIDLFKQTLPFYGDKIMNIFVKNKGMVDNWSFLKEDIEFKNLCKKYSQNIKEIEFARCNVNEKNQMDKHKISLANALNSDLFKILAKQRLIVFKKASFEAIESTGLIDLSTSTEKK